jgi:hypothetical protein
MCRSSFSVVESWSCVDPIFLGLRVNLGSCGCVSIHDLVPF